MVDAKGRYASCLRLPYLGGQKRPARCSMVGIFIGHHTECLRDLTYRSYKDDAQSDHPTAFHRPLRRMVTQCSPFDPLQNLRRKLCKRYCLLLAFVASSKLF